MSSIGLLRVGFVFEREGAVGGELDLAEGLEQADDVEVALADDDVVDFLACSFPSRP